jgi:hypothetical protein
VFRELLIIPSAGENCVFFLKGYCIFGSGNSGKERLEQPVELFYQDKLQEVQAKMIVPVGNVKLQAIQATAPNFARQVMETISNKIPDIVAQIMNAYLDDEVTQLVGRDHYQRRRHAKPKECVAECRKCHSRERQKFRRDGHYQRNLATCYGVCSDWDTTDRMSVWRQSSL